MKNSADLKRLKDSAKNSFYVRFGQIIKEQRSKLCFSQTEVAEILEVSRPTIISYEQGKSSMDLGTAMHLMILLNIDIKMVYSEIFLRLCKLPPPKGRGF